MPKASVEWRSWGRVEDLPADLQRVVVEGAFVPLLDPREAAQLRRTVLEAFTEALDIYIETNELRWRLDHVHRARPKLPMEAVFQAVSVSVGVSVPRLRKIWFESRRKSQMKEAVLRILQKKEPAS